jgi:hypothetical protein
MHNCDEKGNITSRDELIQQWKAEILNARQCEMKKLVRVTYHLFYNSKDDRRDTYSKRWKAAWEYVKYIFSVDLDSAWSHLSVSKEE